MARPGAAGPSRPGVAGHGVVRRCKAWHGRQGEAGHGRVWLGMAWRGQTRLGRPGVVRLGQARRGKAWPSWRGGAGPGRPWPSRRSRRGFVWLGLTQLGSLGGAWLRLSWLGRPGMARRGWAWPCVAWPGWAGQKEAGLFRRPRLSPKMDGYEKTSHRRQRDAILRKLCSNDV